MPYDIIKTGDTKFQLQKIKMHAEKNLKYSNKSVVAILGLWANMPTSNVIVIIFFSAIKF